MPELGVNVDHVATLREARGGVEPDPVKAALICESAGCDSIVAHLREDRRHINDRDVRRIKEAIKIRFNLEMSVNKEIVSIARRLRPCQATLVPERRQELTTEGGMCVSRHKRNIRHAVDRLKEKGINVSMFIDPVKREIEATKEIGVGIIELHTGRYSLARTADAIEREYEKIKKAAEFARSLGLVVNAGHGLNYNNTRKIAGIDGINELNIGHSIISRAVFTGLYTAVREMRKLVK